jgi:serine/threonine protein kinase
MGLLSTSRIGRGRFVADSLQSTNRMQVLFGFPLKLLLLFLMMMHGACAQQAASSNSSNIYTCTSLRQFCSTSILYRTQSSDENLTYVSTLFNTRASIIANASGLSNLTSSTAAPVAYATPFYIPVNCSCQNRTNALTYETLVNRTIKSGDTFSIVANEYEGLTTYQAIEAANRNLQATDLQINKSFSVPLNCACPSSRQHKHGDKLILSFVNFPFETFSVVRSYFNLTPDQLAAANDLNASTESTIKAFTTILVPLVNLPPLSSINFISQSAPASAPSPAPNVSNSGNGSSSSSNKKLYVGIGIGIGAGLIFALLVAAGIICVLLVCHRSKQQGTGHGYGQESSNLETGSILTNDEGTPTKVLYAGAAGSDGVGAVGSAALLDVVGSDKLQVFSYEELREATEDFSDIHWIQGSVFLGNLRGELVAIKLTKGNMTQELKILTQVNHANLVKLIGISTNNTEDLYLVFEYADNGSLSDCLHGKAIDPTTASFSQSVPFLPWTTRIHIALDVASGLDYIHNYANPSFVHKDVKSSNILIDGEFRAKLANFGMAKSTDNGSNPGVGSPVMLTRHIVGTQGYMAPEYLEHGLVTAKADVYAFGVVLLEILSGKEAMVSRQLPSPVEGNDYASGEQRLLSSLFRAEVLEGDNFKEKLQAWMDPLLQNAYPLDTACDTATLAKACLNSDLAVRPNMKDVTYTLSKMLASSLEWESFVLFGNKNTTGKSIDIGR